MKNKNVLTTEEIITDLKKCPRFPICSINKCPLDYESELRTELPKEETCHFAIKKRGRNQRGIRTKMPPHLLRFVPESNLKLLNRGNQKRWHDLQKDGKK